MNILRTALAVSLLLLGQFLFSNEKVSVNILGEGSVEGQGNYKTGTEATLKAIPQQGYEFKGWSGDLAGKENPISFTVATTINAYAHFEPISSDIVLINGMPALAGSFVAKLNETGSKRLRRRVNRVGDTLVFRRNKVLDDIVSIEWDNELKLQENLSGRNLTSEEIQQLAEKRSALKSQGVESQLKQMLNSGNYEFVEPNWVVSPNATPSDSAYGNGTLWGLKNSGQNGGTLDVDGNLEKAWDITTGSSEVIVAVIDSGIRYTHQDLKANMWKNPGEIADNGKDDDGNGFIDDVYGINAISGAAKPGDPFDDNGHGTHCAGTIAAQANGGGKVVGVAWQAKLMALKFLKHDNNGFISDSITCIDYAISKGAHIINASYGSFTYSYAEYQAIERAKKAGIVFVTAAGNDNNDNDSYPTFPNSYDLDNIISVSAIKRNGDLANFSNFGLRNVDLGAPGVSIYSTYYLSDSHYSYMNGTSMAAPHVAGAVALLLSHEPKLAPSQVRERLIDTAKPLQSLSGKTVSGGMLDVHAALTVPPKPTLNLDVDYFPEIPERDGQITVSVRLSAPNPVLGASVKATLGSEYILLDNGFGADMSANDGFYTADVYAPNKLTFDMLITASAPGYETATKTLPVKTVYRPSNDSFQFALPLSSYKDMTIGDNTGATLEMDENIFTVGVTSTVWYSWRPSRSGDATLSTFGSSFDTTLAVYQGDFLGTLQLIASNDDFNDQQFSSKVKFPAYKDEVYWVQVGGAASQQMGEFQINHPQPKAPKPPAPIAYPPFIITKGSDLTKTEGESMTISVEAVGTAPLTYQWVLNGGKIMGADQSSFSIPVLSIEDSGQYSVVVGNAAGSLSADIARLDVRPSQTPPLNDDIENAAPLEGSRGSGLSITRVATGQPDEPDHAGISSPLHSVWWKWTAPRTGDVRVSTEGSSFDTTLAAYQFTDEGSDRRSRGTGKTAASFTPATVSEHLSIQLPDHGFSDGQVVEITGLLGHSSHTARFLINRIDAGSFSLSGTAGLSNLSLSPASRVTPLK